MDMQSIFDAFELLQSWEERFDMVADLGRELLPIDESERTDENLVRGCDTRTWLTGRLTGGDQPVMEYHADAEGPLVRGLVALLLMPFQGKAPDEIIAYDPAPYIAKLGLEEALSMKRRAGMHTFLARVRQIAAETGVNGKR